MRATALRAALPRRQHGIGLVETMVGILIGMLVLLVIYNVFSLAESYKRTATAMADTQVTGVMANFVLARDVMSGGGGISAGLTDLATCNNDVRLKPLPVLIRDSNDNAPAPADPSDSLVVFLSTATRVMNPVLFLSNTPAAGPFSVQSPNGFAANDWVIATDRVPGGGKCSLAQVASVIDPDPANPGIGAVVLNLKPGTLLAPGAPTFLSTTSRLVNLGQISRTRYTVDPTRLQMTMQDVNPSPANVAPPVVPFAQGVVLLKAQYGIDRDNNGTVDCWTSADNSNACGDGVDYSEAALASAATTAQTISRIKAVRIAVVAASDEWSPKDIFVGGPLVNQTMDLFNCSANTNAACQGRIRIDNTVLQGPSSHPVLEDGHRYRLYETTIPLRNPLWNMP